MQRIVLDGRSHNATWIVYPSNDWYYQFYATVRILVQSPRTLDDIAVIRRLAGIVTCDRATIHCKGSGCGYNES